MTKNLLLCSKAGNFLPVEDRQRCATPEHFAQGTSGGLGPQSNHYARRVADPLANPNGTAGHKPTLGKQLPGRSALSGNAFMASLIVTGSSAVYLNRCNVIVPANRA